ncbi:MAG: terminase, partial [Promethearchaeota archaeon]
MANSDSGIIEWPELSIADKVAVKNTAESSFLQFTRVWFQIMQGDKLMINWHHELMADKVDQMISGENRNSLVINIPPGGTKTEFFSIHFPAYQYVKCMTNEIRKF